MSIKKELLKYYIFFKKSHFSSIENVLAMVPATILMPSIVNKAAGMTIFNISNVLLATGIGTILFIVTTQKCFPGYLGSSFAYIGVTSYICQYLNGESRDVIFSYIIGTYLFSGVLLLFLGWLCHLDKTKASKIIDFMIPPAVMGPVVSLIGLELSSQAVEMAGLKDGVYNIDSLVSLTLVMLFIVLSFTKRNIFKNASLFFSFSIICVLCFFLGYWDILLCLKAPILVKPDMSIVIPRFKIPFLIMIIPPTFVVFSENMARKIMTENLKLTLRDKKPNIPLSKSVSANGFALMISAFIKGTPLTIYAENIAVMRINTFLDIEQFIGASIIAIAISFLGPFLYVVQDIPEPILGGLSLSLMGIISVPGIKLLVDKHVNYNKVSNLILTASVFIAGLSGIKVTILATEFKGMSLGLIVGIILNLVIRFLTAIKLNREPFIIDEICNYAQNLPNVNKKMRDDINSDFAPICFYIGEELEENLFLEIIRKFETWEIHVQSKSNMTEEELEKCYVDYNTVPNTKGILNIKEEQLNTKEKFVYVISNSYEYVKKRGSV